MGVNQCCSGNQDNTNNLYEYEFEEDPFESNITHTDSISTKNQSIQLFLQDCQSKLKKSSKLYKDPTLHSDPLILKSSNEVGELKCIFHRPYYFLKDSQAGRGKKYKIFQQGESNSSKIFIKNDALQYFSVFLCFLADNSHLINDIILTQPNTYGIHAVYMYIHGIRTPIYIDDYILCCDDTPIFSQPVNGVYMWPCLLEKAWQKVKGYGAKEISVRSPIQVFQHFLSYPFASYSLNSIEKNVYRELMKKNILLLNKNRTCIVTSKKQPHHKIGLSGRKHFYLKCLFEFQGKSLYYLRNPCGAFDFRGYNRSFTPELQTKIKKQTGEATVAEGNFILEEDEFLQQIEQFLIMYYNKNSNVVSEQVLSLDVDEQLYAQITLQKDEEISISFVQEEMQGDLPFYPVTFQILHEVENGEYNIISGKTNQEGCFGTRSTNLIHDTYQVLQPGNYLIRLKKKLPKESSAPKKKENHDKIVITASKTIEINYALTDLYRNKFYDFLKQHGKAYMGRVSSGSRYRGLDIEHEVVWFGDLVYVYINKVNKSKPKINVQVNFPDKVNLQCINHNLKNEFTAIPLNQDDLLIIFEKIDLTEQTSLGKYFIETF